MDTQNASDTSDFSTRTAAPAPQPSTSDSLGGANPNPSQPGPSQTSPMAGGTSPQQTQPQMSPDQAHSSMVGRVFKSLMGQPNVTYTRDPNTGQMVQTAVPQKAGNLFRSILAGSLLGAAASADQVHNGSGLAAAGVGYTAQQKQAEQQDQLKRQQADQDFQSRLKLNDERRKDEESQRQQQSLDLEKQRTNSTELLNKAQIAQAQAETIRTNTLTQGTDFENHQKVADAGKQNVADYEASGIKPIARGIAEGDEMNQWIKDHPGQTADAEATGVKITTGTDGKPDYHLTYDIYDPKGTVTLSQETISKWKKDGLDPQYLKGLSSGMKLSAKDFVAIKHQADKSYNDNFEKSLKDNQLEESKQRINLTKAETAKNYAEMAREKKDGAESDKQTNLYGESLDELNKVGGDFSKLSPRSKVIMADHAARMLPGLEKSIKDATDEDDQPRAKELTKQYDAIRSLQTQALQSSSQPAAAPQDKLGAATQMLKGRSEADVRTSLKTAPISDADKAKIFQGLFPNTPYTQPAATVPPRNPSIASLLTPPVLFRH